MYIALVGVSGYSGQALYQLLLNHPGVEGIDLYGHLRSDTEAEQTLDIAALNIHTKITPFDPATIMAKDDVIFFATPAGVTSQLAQPFIAADFPVIDLSGDYRLKDPASYTKWYHKPAAPAADLAKATYGLAEFENPTSHYIANPGCYATATILGIAPLLQSEAIDLDSIIVDAKSGLSGAGKKATASSHFVHINENLQMYKLNEHQHIPEIVQELQKFNSDLKAIQFSTTLIPVDRGIMATIYAKANADLITDQVQALYETSYQDKPFIHVSTTEMPDLKRVVGTNNCDIGVSYNPATKTVVVVSVIDNLLKGAAGQAVQNFNKLFDYPETTALPTTTLGF
ncbi:MAG: N-acetyl-gamma-glutamyl-phosphate reductase [Lactobacillus sp.]|jgi:N-acetyl-gamma-glutamyl-phosphate reductase|nr:N-acetyl-gamma-glutamyl-phosphate reductase [Lactobacillus sp.]